MPYTCKLQKSNGAGVDSSWRGLLGSWRGGGRWLGAQVGGGGGLSGEGSKGTNVRGIEGEQKGNR